MQAQQLLSTDKKSALLMTPLHRHITNQKMKGMEVIFSANKEQCDNLDHVKASQMRIDWNDVVNRSVGCQTKETGYKSSKKT